MEERKGFGSNFGFLMAAIGSAVGLGNIWGFPNKMGANGGFTFLIIYLILAACCGFIVMMGELALGRKTGRGAIGVYLGRLFPLVSQGIAVNAGDWLQYGKQYWWLLVLGIVFSTPGPEKLWNRIRGTWLGTVILAVLFWACVYCMSVATNDPFMYFSF